VDGESAGHCGLLVLTGWLWICLLGSIALKIFCAAMEVIFWFIVCFFWGVVDLKVCKIGGVERDSVESGGC
jgi:hypothetical protein